MSRRSKVAKSSLFCFTLMLALKLRHIVSFSWWMIVFPLFVFLTVSRMASFYAIAEAADVFFGFLRHSWRRLARWWLTGLERRQEQARIYNSGSSGYNTFSGYLPAIPQQVRNNPAARVTAIPNNPRTLVKKRPENDLTKEVSRLEAALSEQTEITESSQQKYERLQNERECKICFEGEINTVLLPCRHRILCSTCSKKCENCPICRASIDDRLLVYDG